MSKLKMKVEEFEATGEGEQDPEAKHNLKVFKDTFANIQNSCDFLKMVMQSVERNITSDPVGTYNRMQNLVREHVNELTNYTKSTLASLKLPKEWPQPLVSVPSSSSVGWPYHGIPALTFTQQVVQPHPGMSCVSRPSSSPNPVVSSTGTGHILNSPSSENENSLESVDLKPGEHLGCVQEHDIPADYVEHKEPGGKHNFFNFNDEEMVSVRIQTEQVLEIPDAEVPEEEPVDSELPQINCQVPETIANFVEQEIQSASDDENYSTEPMECDLPVENFPVDVPDKNEDMNMMTIPAAFSNYSDEAIQNILPAQTLDVTSVFPDEELEDFRFLMEEDLHVPVPISTDRDLDCTETGYRSAAMTGQLSQTSAQPVHEENENNDVEPGQFLVNNIPSKKTGDDDRQFFNSLGLRSAIPSSRESTVEGAGVQLVPVININSNAGSDVANHGTSTAIIDQCFPDAEEPFMNLNNTIQKHAAEELESENSDSESEDDRSDYQRRIMIMNQLKGCPKLRSNACVPMPRISSVQLKLLREEGGRCRVFSTPVGNKVHRSTTLELEPGKPGENTNLKQNSDTNYERLEKLLNKLRRINKSHQKAGIKSRRPQSVNSPRKLERKLAKQKSKNSDFNATRALDIMDWITWDGADVADVEPILDSEVDDQNVYQGLPGKSLHGQGQPDFLNSVHGSYSDESDLEMPEKFEKLRKKKTGKGISAMPIQRTELDKKNILPYTPDVGSDSSDSSSEPDQRRRKDVISDDSDEESDSRKKKIPVCVDLSSDDQQYEPCIRVYSENEVTEIPKKGIQKKDASVLCIISSDDEINDEPQSRKKIKPKRGRPRIISDSDTPEEVDVEGSTSDEDFIRISPKRKKGIKRKLSSASSSDEDRRAKVNDEKVKKPRKKRSGRVNIRQIVEKVETATKIALETEAARLECLKNKRKLQDQLPPESVLVLDRETNLRVEPYISMKLEPYQKQGVQFLFDSCFGSSLDDKPGGCILAHLMGLGKTLQTLALIHTVIANCVHGVKTALVLCPLSVTANWERECECWLSECSVKIQSYNISAAKEGEKITLLKKWRETGGIAILHYEGLLVNLGMYNKKAGMDDFDAALELDDAGSMNTEDLQPVSRINCKNKKQGVVPSRSMDHIETMRELILNPGTDMLILDEGHLLKNPKGRMIKAVAEFRTKRRIVLSGTPFQNNLMELHTLVGIIKPKLLGSSKEFRNQFRNPIDNGLHLDSEPEDVALMKRRIFVLTKRLRGCVQRKDYSVMDLKINKYDYALVINLSPLQNEMYTKYLKYCKSVSRSERSNNDEVSHTGGYADYQIFQRLCSHPKLIVPQKSLLKTKVDKKRLSPTNDDDEDKNTLDGQSKHTQVSMLPWYQEFLPRIESASWEDCGKFVLLKAILEHCSRVGDKLLVFSRYTYALDLIEKFIQECSKDWKPRKTYFRIDGNTRNADRSNFCSQFNEELCTAKLFLLSTKAGALGINLHGANRVVLFDVSENPSYDMQSIFRIYRLGQKKECFIYRFVARGGIEQTNFYRAVLKLSLGRRVVDQEHIERHYGSHDTSDLYKFEPSDFSSKSILPTPRDQILKEILNSKEQMKWIYDYKFIDTLLLNHVDENLNEEEKVLAEQELLTDILKGKTEKKAPKAVPGVSTSSMPFNLNAFRKTLNNSEASYSTAELSEMVSRFLEFQYPGLTRSEITARQTEIEGYSCYYQYMTASFPSRARWIFSRNKICDLLGHGIGPRFVDRLCSLYANSHNLSSSSSTRPEASASDSNQQPSTSNTNPTIKASSSLMVPGSKQSDSPRNTPVKNLKVVPLISSPSTVKPPNDVQASPRTPTGSSHSNNASSHRIQLKSTFRSPWKSSSSQGYGSPANDALMTSVYNSYTSDSD